MPRLTETRLRRAFADVLSLVMAGSAVAAAGCGGSAVAAGPGGGGGGPNPEYSSLCTNPGTSRGTLLTGLRASPAFDGAVTRHETAFPRSYPGQPGNVTPDPESVGDAWTGATTETTGSLCGTATDKAACLAKVQGYRVLPTSQQECAATYPAGAYDLTACNVTYILYTRGDAIGVARNVAETKALIGTFDTLDEALWLASTSEAASPNCSNQDTSEYRTTADGGFDLGLYKGGGCAPEEKVRVHVDPLGNLTVIAREAIPQQPCAIGRRPVGLALDLGSASDANAVGRHFAAMAMLETASVTAFRRLERQLKAHGAPPELVARIRTAVRDEIRHARATTALAKRYGITPAAPCIAAAEAAPSLLAIALENAREGCVRETYGALVAHYQRTHARDAEVRAVMDAIADEETEHAALSWDIAAWIEAQLDAPGRALLAAERRSAFTTLARELAAAIDPELQSLSGMPGPEEAIALLEALAPVMLAAA